VKTLKDHIKARIRVLDYDLQRLDRLKAESDLRDLKPAEIELWRKRFQAWRDTLQDLLDNWGDPTQSDQYRFSAVGRVVEGLRMEDQVGKGRRLDRYD